MANRYRCTNMYYMLLKRLWSQLKHQPSPNKLNTVEIFINTMVQFQYNLQIFEHRLLWFCVLVDCLIFLVFFIHRFHIPPFFSLKEKEKTRY